ncbi:hypothetical protein MSG28_008088 [Choristoneura fumiferana]|uniref:Uncharacterized protein n=1 Tax=Choristoneura fumiferana TaxID=7141 RepID=A0ACC0JAA0_CHOFU|nr:hypothetical protein MSG28_008088 [Choristoneura fumiferana]
MAGYFEEMGWRELADGEQPDHLLHMARFLVDFGLYEDNFSGEWPRLPPPAAKEAVENLPEVTLEEGSKDCPICLKKYNPGDKAKKMPCNHLFHSTCILTWLGKAVLLATSPSTSLGMRRNVRVHVVDHVVLQQERAQRHQYGHRLIYRPWASWQENVYAQ